jgi:hypothetical protein
MALYRAQAVEAVAIVGFALWANPARRVNWRYLDPLLWHGLLTVPLR